jgi:hypothetical protein
MAPIKKGLLKSFAQALRLPGLLFRLERQSVPPREENRPVADHMRAAEGAAAVTGQTAGRRSFVATTPAGRAAESYHTPTIGAMVCGAPAPAVWKWGDMSNTGLD